MELVTGYRSPLGEIVLLFDGGALAGLWFAGQKYFPGDLPPVSEKADAPAVREVRRWLDVYFAGRDPGFMPPLAPRGSAFRQAVWAELLKIPYGGTATYGAIARALGCRSAQAVGGAVGHNPISILIPCHRVLGADGGLTGYAGGIERKRALLELERRGSLP